MFFINSTKKKLVVMVIVCLGVIYAGIQAQDTTKILGKRISHKIQKKRIKRIKKIKTMVENHPRQINKQDRHYQTITLGGGCFWCVEGVYQRIKGVVSVIPGYSGGKSTNPTYDKVCGPTNDHIEVCQIIYDPTIVSTKEILRIFFFMHNPTTPNKQDNDVGYQYNSAIFYHTTEQRDVALQKVKELFELEYFSKPIITKIEPIDKFYPAEKYHRNYYNENKEQPYCKFIILPKILKMQKILKEKMR